MLVRIAAALNTHPLVLSMSFARMADGLGNSMVIILLPLFIHDIAPTQFNVPQPLLIGWVISVFGLLQAFLQPLSGYWTDRVGRRKPFIVGGLGLMALAGSGFVLAQTYSEILLLRAVQGIAVAMVVPASMALVSQTTSIRHRGNAMGVYTTFRMLGFGLGPLIAGITYETVGLPAAFGLGAACVFVGMLLVKATVHEDGEPRAPHEQANPKQHPLPWSRAGRPNRTSLALCFASIVLASSLSMIATLENEFNARLQQTAIGFGVAFSALTFTRMFLQIPIGRLSDRIGRKTLIVFGLLALAPITALFGHVASTLQLIALRMLQGVTSAAIAAPSFALAGDLATRGGEATQLSYVSMGFGLGLATGPLLTGFMAGYVSFQAPFYIMAALAVLAAGFVALFAPETVRAAR